MKRDPYKNKERWESWQNKHFASAPEGIRQVDWKILIDFLKDMELGLNVPKEKKGKRQAGTLLNLSSHNQLFLKNFKKPLIELTKRDLHGLEADVEEGRILKRGGKKFTSFGNYIKDFKAFWNWGLRTKVFTENIIEDISAKVEKPSWVYLTDGEVRNLFNKMSFDYRAICFFLYDSGMRVTEANSIQIKCFNKDFTQVTIPDDVAKTFGRTMNLKLCSGIIKEYVEQHELGPEDYIFQKKVFTINKYLRYHSKKLFGEGISHPKAGGRYPEFTMYDIRHNSACFWFNKYPTARGIMYRFGWRKSDKIEYYSGFLGVTDEITDSDMVVGEDKNKIIRLEEKIEKQSEELNNMKKYLMRYLKTTERPDSLLKMYKDKKLIDEDEMNEIVEFQAQDHKLPAIDNS